ncbi:Uncharacterised protein [Serratia fonticola]|uniref:Uncharacterized protein n=1 Tax=Serratia fonticola TaxID=47917 RepID=A0A4U9TBQ7_SERFO|nr:Uncharacterised protein [Serratia fonticola]
MLQAWGLLISMMPRQPRLIFVRVLSRPSRSVLSATSQEFPRLPFNPWWIRGDPLLLSFHISAQVDFDNIGDVVEFNIQLDSNRRYCLNQEA